MWKSSSILPARPPTSVQPASLGAARRDSPPSRRVLFVATQMDSLAPTLFQALLFAACIRRWRAKRRWQQEKAQAKKLWDKLIEVLGGKCAECGTRKNLSINHVDGRSWSVVDCAYVKRVKRYWTEYKSGVKLNVMCGSHNGGWRPREQHNWKRRGA